MPEVHLNFPPGALQAKAIAALAAGVTAAGQVAEGIAKSNAPHQTGTLSGGIKAQPTEISGSGASVKVETTTAQDYAAVQELGYWVNFRGKYGPLTMHGGKPRYMQRALITTAPKLEQIVSAKVAAAF